MPRNLRTFIHGPILFAAFFHAASQPVFADIFGSPGNNFTIDFVTVGNPGNADDSTAGGGSYFRPLGGVAYTYRIGVTEVPLNWVTRAIADGLTNVSATALSPDHPAGLLVWYESAAFVNWLNISTGHHAAYNLTFDGITFGKVSPWFEEDAWDNDPGSGVELNYYRHKNAYYFLPTDDEWYKAAFHKNDGVTANYWDYATASDTAPAAVSSGTVPGTLIFQSVSPATVDNAGGLSPYGTRGQTGNVMEWSESESPDGISLNGSWYAGSESEMRSSFFSGQIRDDSHANVGFRVASVPEASSGILFLCGAGLFLVFRRLLVAKE
jgi:formylglycine-generating enzyme required for sulfatase activity